MLPLDFTNKRALVTGGSRGIGRAAALLLARGGAAVGISYERREDIAAATVRELQALGVPAFAHAGDLSNEAAADALVQRTVDQLGGLDIFVGNAGIWPADDIALQDMTAQQWHRTIAVNLDGIFFSTRAAARAMSSGGYIVLISSTAGQRGEAGHVDYAATKGAVISMVKSLAVELGPRQINVNSVAPGWVDTEMVVAPLTGNRGAIERAIPIGRVASAEDIAGPIAFLCSDLARHITGEILNVNGGSVLCG